MKYDLVIFDMDGTLVDTDLMLVETVMIMFRKHRPDFKISLSEIVYFSGPPIEDTLAHYFPGHDTGALIQEFKDISKQFYDLDAILFPYAREALIEIKKLGVPVAVLTNKHRGRTIETLKMLQIDDFVDYVVGYDDVKKPKPDPEGMLKIIDHYQVAPHKALFLGDTVYDYEAARNSGVISGLIGWSLRRFPETVKPDLWLHDYRDLVEVVKHGSNHL
ncbi:MAG: HAD family hydrolase [Bacilli bacterium]|jgi:HAD superfamily hydrolase (TIGR01549 family)